jgi:hypothetical protein
MRDLTKIGIQELHLILHNMRIYGVSMKKRQLVINEINSRNDASNK